MMRKTAAFALSLALLCCSACGAAQVSTPPPLATPEQKSSEALVLEARIAELEDELAAANERAANPQTELGEYAYYNMVYTEPEYTQVIVNCPDGAVTSPVEYGFKCSHPMENEYAEVLAACHIKENAALKEPQETWLLIRSGVWDASEGDIGWVPLECVTEYTSENMYTVTHSLKVDASAIDWNYGFVSCSDSSGSEVTVGYHGGGEATIPADCLLYPEPGVTGWFD